MSYEQKIIVGEHLKDGVLKIASCEEKKKENISNSISVMWMKM